MGNRAVIAFSDNPNAVAVYLHWNGGRASVEGFLAAARDLKIGGDDTARLTQMICNWFGGHLSVYVDILKRQDCDNGDNGLYIVDPRSMTIKSRKFARPIEEINPEKTELIRIQCVERSKAAFNGWEQSPRRALLRPRHGKRGEHEPTLPAGVDS